MVLPSLLTASRAWVSRSSRVIGWTIPSPPGSMFAWVPIPDDFKALGSVGFAKKLMEEADVAVAPGLVFGEPAPDAEPGLREEH